MTKMRAIAISLLLVITITGAASFFLIGVAVESIPPTTLAAIRLTIAAFFLGLMSRKPQGPGWRPIHAGVAILGLAIPFFLISWAQTHLAASTAAVLIATTPIFATMLAYGAGAIRPGPYVWGGVALGFIGVAGFLDVGSRTPSLDSWLPQMALVCSALSFAAAGRLVALSSGGSSVETAAVVARWAALIMVPASLIVDAPWRLDIPPAKAQLAAVLLGAGSTAFYVAYYRLIASAGLAFASTHHFLIPVLALGLDTLIDHRLLSITQLAYVAAILVGVALSATPSRTTSVDAPVDRDSNSSKRNQHERPALPVTRPARG
jgi:drug/metabolite transporter (DMT)-like permease